MHVCWKLLLESEKSTTMPFGRIEAPRKKNQQLFFRPALASLNGTCHLAELKHRKIKNKKEENGF
jgi:hypothetical protein